MVGGTHLPGQTLEPLKGGSRSYLTELRIQRDSVDKVPLYNSSSRKVSPLPLSMGTIAVKVDLTSYNVICDK